MAAPAAQDKLAEVAEAGTATARGLNLDEHYETNVGPA
jgi:hypothetical protein